MSNFYEQKDSARFSRFTKSDQMDWDIPNITAGFTMEQYDREQAGCREHNYRMMRLRGFLTTGHDRCGCPLDG